MRHNTYKVYLFAYTHPLYLLRMSSSGSHAELVVFLVKASSVSLLLGPQGNYNPLKTGHMSALFFLWHTVGFFA